MRLHNFINIIGLLLFTNVALGQSKLIEINLENINPKVDYWILDFNQNKTKVKSDSTGKISVQIDQDYWGGIQVKHNKYNTALIVLDSSLTELSFNLEMEPNGNDLDMVVVSGTMRPVVRSKSPVSIEVFNASFFKANKAPTFFESIQMVNGVRPQVNCNVCNTGDIHINGLEGPYNTVLIDGMPIVSGLASVYGLNGIPQSLIERIEVIKGPASTLYGSEAVGGLINIITKDHHQAPKFSAEVMANSWGGWNTDWSFKSSLNKKNTVQLLVGAHINVFNSIKDYNLDGFTDIALYGTSSLFTKWSFKQKKAQPIQLATRMVYDNRWGGEVTWKREHKGGDDIYGEAITTKRLELISVVPFSENLKLQWSATSHLQNSAYGTTIFNAKQHIGFTQFVYQKSFLKHHLLLGQSFRFTYYDDNTVATEKVKNNVVENLPSQILLPGFFMQDEWEITPQHTLLGGLRCDYDKRHGSIFSPRLNYKWNSIDASRALRFGIGNGFRVAQIFTEDHAALSGARDVVFTNQLKPEQSWNVTLNLAQKFFFENGNFTNFELNGFWTRFTNKIIPDYTTDHQKIIYDNLKGYAISQGIGFMNEWRVYYGLTARIGVTLQDVFSVENHLKNRQLLTEKWSGNWSIGYQLKRWNCTIDYTGNIYGSMLLPLAGPMDPRPKQSPIYSIQNLQITKRFHSNIECFIGVKNILNWTPYRNLPFLIARANDPFDKQVQWDSNGDPIPTTNNPYALTFDPTYVYAANQGRRFTIGFKYEMQGKSKL
jgi:outer membrane receptor for ferrienterochelin and colicins